MNEPLTCVFVPYWPANPYQDQLAKSLESCGVHVDKAKSLRTVFCRTLLRRDRPDIIHLHWLPRFEWGLAPLLRLVLFLVGLCVLRVFGTVLILTVHNLRPHESRSPRADWLVSKIVIAMTRALIVHSETARREVVSTFRLTAHGKKMFIVPHGNYVNVYDNSIEPRQRGPDWVSLTHGSPCSSWGTSDRTRGCWNS